ncbi:helix-turn-helix domain-containing protein [Streptomyces filamentosus]|uniref:helix-turn-helix domain-containing protein n=1 Tax=Streptomyces filamentosus TaxID=67294 RepID=UPI0033DC7CB2
MPSGHSAWVLAQRRAVGARIQAAREHAHLSQFALAERCDVDHKAIHRIEYGTSDLSLGLLLRLARVLGVPLADLVQ